MRKLIFILLILCCFSIPALAQKTSQTHFRFGTSETTSFIGRYQSRVLTEAFRRNGLTIEFVEVHNRQALIDMVEKGLLDGDARRVTDFTQAGNYPGYVKIDEQTYTLAIAAYSKTPYKAESWADLGRLGVSVGYVQGVKIVEKQLGENVPPDLIKQYPGRLEGMRALSKGDVAVMIIANQYRAWEILKTDEFHDSGIQELAMLEKTGMCPYFSKKHAALAPVIANTIRQMKREGVLQQILMEVMTK